MVGVTPNVWATGAKGRPVGTVSSRHFFGRWLRRKGPTKKKKTLYLEVVTGDARNVDYSSIRT